MNGMGALRMPATDSPSSPLTGAYWVLPGRLLAGPYPGAPTWGETRARLEALLRAGVGGVLRLTQAHEARYQMRAHVAYEMELLALARARRRPLAIHRFPLLRGLAPERRALAAILDGLDLALAGGRIVYLHCWSGTGRSGMVAGCHLVRHDLASPDRALERLEELRRLAGLESGRTPELAGQRRLVRAWRPGD